MTFDASRQMAVSEFSVFALRQIVGKLADPPLASVLLSLADLIESARGGDMGPTEGDMMQIDHIRSRIAGLSPAAEPTERTPGAFDGGFLAEAALMALRNSHRDTGWIANAALDHSMRLVIDEGFGEAMELANKACKVRDAIAQRIAMLEPEIASAAITQASDGSKMVRH